MAGSSRRRHSGLSPSSCSRSSSWAVGLGGGRKGGKKEGGLKAERGWRWMQQQQLLGLERCKREGERAWRTAGKECRQHACGKQRRPAQPTCTPSRMVLSSRVWTSGDTICGAGRRHGGVECSGWRGGHLTRSRNVNISALLVCVVLPLPLPACPLPPQPTRVSSRCETTKEMTWRRPSPSMAAWSSTGGSQRCTACTCAAGCSGQGALQGQAGGIDEVRGGRGVLPARNPGRIRWGLRG